MEILNLNIVGLQEDISSSSPLSGSKLNFSAAKIGHQQRTTPWKFNSSPLKINGWKIKFPCGFRCIYLWGHAMFDLGRVPPDFLHLKIQVPFSEISFLQISDSRFPSAMVKSRVFLGMGDLPPCSRESLFHGCINPYGLGLMSLSYMEIMGVDRPRHTWFSVRFHVAQHKTKTGNRFPKALVDEMQRAKASPNANVPKGPKNGHHRQTSHPAIIFNCSHFTGIWFLNIE